VPAEYLLCGSPWRVSVRRLKVTIRNGGQSVLEFKYNADGIRTSKTVGNVKHVYTLQGSQIVSEAWGNYLLIYLYDESGSPIGMQYRESSYAADVYDTFYFEKNLQGDIIAVYNESGLKIVSYNYDAWGNHTYTWHDISSANIPAAYNPFRYRGYYYDTDTQLYYLQSRYYNPATGRFINVDSVLYNNMLGYNMYLYCNNNPINFYDPTGENGEAIMGTWVASMWWLNFIDGPIPIGDIIFWVGCIVAGIIIVAEATVLLEGMDEPITEPTPDTDNSEDSSDADDAHNKVTGRHLLPKGEPNSDSDLYDEEGLRQTRHYGPDGWAEYDIDYRHQDSHNNHTFPHRHNFDWSTKPPRGEAIDIFP